PTLTSTLFPYTTLFRSIYYLKSPSNVGHCSIQKRPRTYRPRHRSHFKFFNLLIALPNSESSCHCDSLLHSNSTILSIMFNTIIVSSLVKILSATRNGDLNINE